MNHREATARVQALCDRLGAGWTPAMLPVPIPPLSASVEETGEYVYHANSGYLCVHERWNANGNAVYIATAGNPDQTPPFYASQSMSTPEAAVADVLLRMSTDVRRRAHARSEAWAAPGVSTIQRLLHVGARVGVWFQDAWRGGVVLRRETIVNYDLAIVEFDEPVGLDRQTIADPELFGVEHTGGWRLAGWTI